MNSRPGSGAVISMEEMLWVIVVRLCKSEDEIPELLRAAYALGDVLLRSCRTILMRSDERARIAMSI